MSAPTLEALSGQAGIDDVRRALAGRRALSSPHGATVKLNPDQQKRMIVFDTATIVADSDRYLPTVQSALRIVALSHPEAAERVVALPLRTVETMHAVLKRSEEHTSELQSLMRISYAVFCLKKKTQNHTKTPEIVRDRSTVQ